MRYIKLLGLEMMVFAIGATVLFGQGNQEAGNLTREGIEASKAKDWDKAIAAFKRAAQLDEHYAPNLASALQQRATVYVSQGKFLEAKLHAPPTPPPTPSGPIPNPNVRPPATVTATPATKP